MIRIITDSTAYIPKDFAEDNHIIVLPLTVTLENEEFDDSNPNCFEEFFEKVDKSKTSPQSSQPNISLVHEAFENVLKNGDEAIAISISASLSGTQSTFNIVKNELDTENKISVLDSQTVGQTIFLYIKEAIKMINEGKTRAEICERIINLQKESFISFVPENLDSLKRGGRIGKVGYFIASILKIKPVLTFKQGVLNCVKKVVGIKNAMISLIKQIPQKVKEIMVLKIAKSSHFEEFKNMVKTAHPNVPITTGDLGPAVGTHVGKAIGLCCLVEQ